MRGGGIDEGYWGQGREDVCLPVVVHVLRGSSYLEDKCVLSGWRGGGVTERGVENGGSGIRCAMGEFYYSSGC